MFDNTIMELGSGLESMSPLEDGADVLLKPVGPGGSAGGILVSTSDPFTDIFMNNFGVTSLMGDLMGAIGPMNFQSISAQQHEDRRPEWCREQARFQTEASMLPWGFDLMAGAGMIDTRIFPKPEAELAFEIAAHHGLEAAALILERVAAAYENGFTKLSKGGWGKIIQSPGKTTFTSVLNKGGSVAKGTGTVLKVYTLFQAGRIYSDSYQRCMNWYHGTEGVRY
jgi:hypothetical protein